MAVSWRVKLWKFTGTANATIVYTNSPSPPDTFTGEAELIENFLYALSLPGVAATLERDLVSRVFNPTYQALVNYGVSPINGSPIMTNWETHSDFLNQSGTASTDGISMFNQFVLWDPSTNTFGLPAVGMGNLIKPTVTALITIAAGVFRNPVTVTSGTGAFFIQGPGTLTVKSLVASDFVIPMQVSSRLNGMDPASTSTGSATCALTLEAVEFWPYADSQGLPVYDTATGAQLRNPFG